MTPCLLKFKLHSPQNKTKKLKIGYFGVSSKKTRKLGKYQYSHAPYSKSNMGNGQPNIPCKVWYVCSKVKQ